MTKHILILAILAISPFVNAAQVVEPPDSGKSPSTVTAPVQNPQTSPPTSDAQSVPKSSEPNPRYIILDGKAQKDAWDKAYVGFTGGLVVVAIITLGVVWYQATKTREAAEATREAAKAAQDTVGKIAEQIGVMREQNEILGRSVVEAKRSADAARGGLDALVATERAWIDGEIHLKAVAGAMRWAIRITNVGKTPAVVRRWRIDYGTVKHGEKLIQEALTSTRGEGLGILLRSEREHEVFTFKAQELFDNADGTESGMLCITITYGDVTSSAEDVEGERKSYFVYSYQPVTTRWERLSYFSRYT